MNLLLTSSTTEEIAKTIEFLEQNWEKENFWTYTNGDTKVTTLITGIGSVFTTFSLSRFEGIGGIDYVINPGIGAANSRIIDLGRVYLITKEQFGDIGLEESDGNFSDLHDLQWSDPDRYPFSKGYLTPKKIYNPTFLPTASAITVNKIPGAYQHIEQFQKKYHIDIVNLNGAAAMYVCNSLDVDLIQYRVCSRYIEPWQKETGDLTKALNQLNMRTIDILKSLSTPVIPKTARFY